ncbi:hypothetical protein [Pseudoalteromonas denitrificans]|jgi:hypothetical protein|uniref:Uncharacterized protein n=1 Tax=Pseudoalteromonas denitrificans DSM 6059 TaxID=1123010 RepID=A0A1I1Q179_9GAMM|nr:hypothetical protein [Pseudoalteromonas denitrificans]SFD15717.1 hypothetical protein SAMN02745724_03698 [Pseudoalteromonas denitrificans DSM 6059]
MLSSNKVDKKVEELKWAFRKGYLLATSDIKEGIHINYREIEQNFLKELLNIVPEENKTGCFKSLG